MAIIVAAAVGLLVTASFLVVRQNIASWGEDDLASAKVAASSQPRFPVHALDPQIRTQLQAQWKQITKEAQVIEPKPSVGLPVIQSEGGAPSRLKTLTVSGARPPHADYTALGGPQEEYQAVAHHSALPAPVVSKASSKPSSLGRGTLVWARLRDDVASTPIGAPFIAHLTKSAKVGSLQLAPGAELHGVTCAYQGEDDRLHLRVEFVRLADQSLYPVTGWVRDLQGRAGLCGNTQEPRTRAGQAGLVAVGRMARRAGRALAQQSGSLLGVGIEEAVDVAPDALEPVSTRREPVVVSRHTPLQVYIGSVGPTEQAFAR